MKNFLLIFALVTSFYLDACTDFLLKAEDQSCVVGRSMEFGIPLGSQILLQPKGQNFSTKLKNGQEGISWKSKYDYVGITYLGTDYLVDGVNEKGLSIGALWFPNAAYPKVDFSKPEDTVSLARFIDWILGSFETLAEVEEALQKIQIWPHPVPAIEMVPPLHFSLHEKSGECLVIEFLSGKMVVSRNPVGVLTNAPYFEWHLVNLRNYINLSSVNVAPTSFEGTVLDPTGQGTGLLGLPGDWTPPSRFVRVALMKKFVKTPKDPKSNLNLALHLLNMVDIPYGGIQSSTEKEFDYTQWVIIKDLSHFQLTFRTYEELIPVTIDMKETFRGLKEPKKLEMRGRR